MFRGGRGIARVQGEDDRVHPHQIMWQMSLRQKVLSGLLWVGGGRLLSQLLTWAITIVVIRLLTPDDYGLLSMAMAMVGLLTLMCDAGLDAAVVQASEVDENKLRKIFGAVIVVDFALFASLVIVAPAVADFFSEQRLVWIIRALALQFLFWMFAAIPAALLTRSWNFKHQSMINLAVATCGGLSTLACALSGYGVWSLVLGYLASQLLYTVVMNIASPFRKWPHFSMEGMRSLIAFGGHVMVTRVLWYVYSQADIVIAGKLLGKESLGFYSVSMHLASLPVQKISGVINQVAFPAFARCRDDPILVSQYALKTVRVLAFLSLPILWGMSCTAPEIVAVLLGPKWGPAALPLQLLALVMPFYFITVFLNTACQGMGYGAVASTNALVACLTMPAAFWVGANWGLLGLSLAWVVGYPLVMCMNLRRMLPLLGVTFHELLSAIAPAALAGAGMYIAVGIARSVASDRLGELLLMILFGAATYAVVAVVTNREGLREIAELLSLDQLRYKDGGPSRRQESDTRNDGVS